MVYKLWIGATDLINVEHHDVSSAVSRIGLALFVFRIDVYWVTQPPRIQKTNDNRYAMR
jgi:hypothetical protein